MTENEYTEACESNMGYCTNCKDFTTDSCEPDARKYKCDVCDLRTVFGAEEALMMGIIEIDEPNAD